MSKTGYRQVALPPDLLVVSAPHPLDLKRVKDMALLDAGRQRLCLEDMSKGQSLAEIAQGLGYNDQAAFTRAFRRWYGEPPSRYRASHFDNG